MTIAVRLTAGDYGLPDPTLLLRGVKPPNPASLHNEAERPEGWYRDPFEVHTDRWFSDGQPTSLVRDDGLESHDPSPADHWDGPLIEPTRLEPPGGGDLKRADAAEAVESGTYDSGREALDHGSAASFGFPID